MICMNGIKGDLTIKLVAGFALLLVGFGGGGLLGLMFAYGLTPTSIQLDISKATALGAVIGMTLSLLTVLHAIYTDHRDRRKS